MLFLFFSIFTLEISSPQEISLSNKYLTITWNINDSNSLHTKNILNQRTSVDVNLFPQLGSEEFTISIIRDNPSPYPLPITNKHKWNISSNSEKSIVGNYGPIKNLIDNDPQTIWHSWESYEPGGHDDRPNHKGDFNITIDFGETLTFKAISFTQSPFKTDGIVRKFKLYIGNSIKDVTDNVNKGQFILDSYFSQDKNKKCFLNLTSAATCQFVVITTDGNGTSATGAQFDIYSDFLPYVNDVIKASELKCMKFTKDYNKVTFSFDTFEFRGAKFDITEIVELIEDKPYLEKHLEIKCSDENVKIDYIDLDHYVLSNDDFSKSWTCPFRNQLFLNLGQPFYMNSFYAGCLFPYTHTMIETTSNLARIRYYSGKSFKELKKNDQNAYVTWKTILGAAHDSQYEVVRDDFFSFIRNISLPLKFRKQYNTWYDQMLSINEKSAMNSFKEIERGFTQYGLPPIDSYVVDDGWNNYNSEKYGVYDIEVSGTTYNNEGFWEFNDKFPNNFTKLSNFSHKILSNFGTWFGPRGGNSTAGKFGQMIEDSGKGFYNPQSDDIDVGSHKYLKNIKNFLVDLIQAYKVNYIKFDGFANQPCFNETHDHIVGGPDGLYFYTDLWENVIEIYEDLRKTANETGIENFWITTKKYSSQSPFLLQWSNSVFLQNSEDKVLIIFDKYSTIKFAEQMLKYRDYCYWQLYNEFQFQIPQPYIYSNDPIYGRANLVLFNKIDDEFFRNFLFGCAMRGTALFEMYYSYFMLNEGDKWYINSEVLSWVESHFNLLQHSKMIGGNPGKDDAYGFSAWNETNGIIGIRNHRSYKIVLNKTIGVPENIGTVYRFTLLKNTTTDTNETKNKVPFRYGDEFVIDHYYYRNYEYLIYEFKKTIDTDPPKIEVVIATKDTEIMIRFNRRVIIDNATFIVEGIAVNNSKLRGDRRTVTLTTSQMNNYTNYKLQIKGVKDLCDNELITTVDFQYFSNNLIAYIRGEFSGTNSIFVSTTVKTDSFTIRLNVKYFNNVKDAVLIHSEDNSIIVEITKDNRMKFTLRNTSITSKSEITNETHFITFVRERNAMLKIYFEDEIDSSILDKQTTDTVLIHNLLLNKNDVIYTYVKVFNYGLAYSEISKEISLKNKYIERVFSISNNKVKTLEIINHRIDQKISFIPQEGTEEFTFFVPVHFDIKIFDKNIEHFTINRTNWKIYANSEHISSYHYNKEGPVVYLIDGNLSTIWHSKYDDHDPTGHDDRIDKDDPFQVTIDLGEQTDFKAFSYTPRQDGIPNGDIRHYEIYVENSMKDLNESIKNKKYKSKGDFEYINNIKPTKYVNFNSTQSGRYIALLSLNHDSYGSGADFSLYSTSLIKSSSFELDHYELDEKENSQILTFTYKPFNYDNIQYNVTVEYTLQNDKNYIEKEIKIKIPEDKYNHTKIYCIDLENFVISNDDKNHSWSHPFVNSSGDYISSNYILTLGQPIYINSFFIGCRFPFSDSQIFGNQTHLRYQSRKTFGQLKHDDDGFYHCWKTVIGSSRSTNIDVVRGDFYSYISDISVDNKFRKQYNSWYDWMLSINESNILTSFKEIEKGLTQMGVKPLNSYVIDDGWNNYNYNNDTYHVYDEIKSGSTYNNVGFWSINNKFTNGFSNPSDFTHTISSNFGVWLGPRGGYNFNRQFGHMIENAGFGFYNSESDDVDVASTKYTEKLKDFMNNLITEYKVNYFKLDGWLHQPCKNVNHDHIVGGFDGIYEYTDYWERYIEVFKSMRKTALENHVNDLWLSLTYYINPSPFHLQWANSIWIQISDEIGYIKLSDQDTLCDQILNYRDNCYYNFYKVFQFQLPQKFVYNHDPIYCKNGTKHETTLSDDEFRKYLFMCGMRGTSLFELYYSSAMLDEGEKWFINSEVLNYIEKRHEVLQNSQIFGDEPGLGNVYGYSAWSKDRGTIAIRNPSDKVTEYTIKLNQEIGVPETIGTTYRKTVLDFNTIEDLSEGQSQKYGDEIKVTLQPREVRIIDFEPEEDKISLKVDVIKAINQKEIQIRFNKRIQFDINNYLIDDVKLQKGKLHGDLRTVSLYLQNLLENNTQYLISFRDVKDSIGNVLNTNIRYTYMSGNMIVTVPNEIGPIEEEILLSTNDYQVDSFTIHLNIKEIKDVTSNQVLIKDDENEISVEIFDKKIKFNVNSVSVSSNQELRLNDNFNVTCVRERNTMLKLYINDQLSQSNFVENQKETVHFQYIEICKSTAIFNSIFISSYGYSYKDVFEMNGKIIRLQTAVAEATSEQEGHIAMYAIDDNELTYWLSDKGQNQSIKVTLDRIVFVEKIRYFAHSENTTIKDYTISFSFDGIEWKEMEGIFERKNDHNEAIINQKVKYFILKGNSVSDSISASQIYFFGFEVENEDHNPTLPPPPTRHPTETETETEEPTPKPDGKKSRNKSIIITGISIGIVVIIALIVIIVIIIVKKKKNSNPRMYSEPLLTIG